MLTPKSYTYATSGLVLGALVALILHDVLGLPAGFKFYLWLILISGAGCAGGFIVGLIEPNDQRPDSEPDVESGETAISTTMRFFAIADKSSSDLKPVEVRFAKPPQAPPDMELELLIENYNDTARCNVMEGVLSKLTLRELVERVTTEANSRAPKQAKNADLQVVGLRSEGPVQPDSRCVEGWTFELVDDLLGLSATVITTQTGISFRYATAVTHIEPKNKQIPDIQRILGEVRAQIPALEDVPLYLRAILSDEVLLYPPSAPFVLDVDPESGRARNVEWASEQADRWPEIRASVERFTLDDIFRWSKGEELGGGDFQQAIADSSFADRVRTFELQAMKRVGRALFAEYGPGVVRELAQRAMDPTDENDPKLEIELLAHVPSGLAIAALHDLVATAPDDLARVEAEKLFAEVRSGERQLAVDKIGRLDFLRSRALMGKMQHRIVPLRSTFALEDELLAPLGDEIGLGVRQRRLLSGDSGLALEVYLRPDRGNTEALIVSSPLPVPCYVLHLVGSAADTFAERTEKAGLTYGRSTMIQDLRSTVPTRVHRAALYLAALHEPSPDGWEPLVEAYRKGRADRNLRRAMLFALAYTPGEEATDFITRRAEDPKHDDSGAAQEALSRRREQGLVSSTAAELADTEAELDAEAD